MKKSTEELLALLKKSDNLDSFLEESENDMIETSLQEQLSLFIEKSNKKPAEILRRAGIEKSYGYDILSGKRTPSREKVLALIFALSLSASDAQALLKSCGYPPLYPKILRDSVILFCLDKEIELSDTNETLYDLGLELID